MDGGRHDKHRDELPRWCTDAPSCREAASACDRRRPEPLDRRTGTRVAHASAVDRGDDPKPVGELLGE